MSQPSKLSPYRWIIEVLLLLLLTAQSLAWLAPAPILQEIRNGLKISLGDAGLIISVIALCIGIFSLLGAVVAERIGALRALVIGIWLLAIGQVASGYAPDFAALLACRVLEGIGYGLVISPPGMLMMQWFGEGEWPYINMINFAFGYVGLTVVFRATPALFAAVGSWRMVLLWYGVGSAGVALLWTLFGREHRSETSVSAPGAVEAPAERGSALMEVVKMRNVLLIAAGLFGGMWVFQIYTAFLPEFFRTYRAMTLSQASLMTQVLPLAGLFAALGGGIGTGMSGLRKPFTWPIAFTNPGRMRRRDCTARSDVDQALAGAGRDRSGGIARRDHNPADGITRHESDAVGSRNRLRLGGRLLRRVHLALSGRRARGADWTARRDARLSGLPIPADRDDVLPARNRAEPRAL